jgi:hypothetical protein
MEPRSVAERIAAEVFVYLMQRSQVRPYDVATHCQSAFTERDTSRTSGPRYEIVRHLEPSPPFWPLTVNRDNRSGYGINCEATCIRYEQRSYPSDGYVFGFIGERAEFGPGCEELMRRATAHNPVFVCEILSPRSGVEIVKKTLIDAALSLIEGRGPLVVNGADDS